MNIIDNFTTKWCTVFLVFCYVHEPFVFLIVASIWSHCSLDIWNKNVILQNYVLTFKEKQVYNVIM